MQYISANGSQLIVTRLAACKTLQLGKGSRAQLQRIAKRSKDWYERERAQVPLLLDSGLCVQGVADLLGLNVRTVRTTHIRWRQDALGSLSDKPRIGVLHKLNSGHVQRLVPWAKTSYSPPLPCWRATWTVAAPACTSAPW